MQATISKWGNSLALRLPRHVADQVHLEDGATVDLQVDGDSIRITPTRKKFKLSELLANEPAREGVATSRESDWGEPKGEEVW
jgi:antitoxin MazE